MLHFDPTFSLFFIQGVFWRSQLYIDQPQFLKFNISVQKDALVGVYGRKGLPPSHTQVGYPGCTSARKSISLLENVFVTWDFLL